MCFINFFSQYICLLFTFLQLICQKYYLYSLRFIYHCKNELYFFLLGNCVGIFTPDIIFIISLNGIIHANQITIRNHSYVSEVLFHIKNSHGDQFKGI